MENENKRIVGPVTGLATVGAALGVVITYLLTLLGVELPAPVELAMVTLLTALGGWLVKPGNGTRRA